MLRKNINTKYKYVQEKLKWKFQRYLSRKNLNTKHKHI